MWCIVPRVLSQWVGFTSRLVANWTNQFTNQAQEINLANAIDTNNCYISALYINLSIR